MNGIKIAVLGWNDNTLCCVKALMKAKLGPSVVILAKGYDFKSLRDYCLRKGLRVLYAGASGNIRGLTKDCNMLISVSWPYYIRTKDRETFTCGAINVHASLLPKYRGQHPINWALIKDEKELGVTVHFLEKGIDSGDILLQAGFRVRDSDTLLSIRKKVHSLGGLLLTKAIKLLLAGRVLPVKQDNRKATFAPKRKAEDGRINWDNSGRRIFAFVRGISHPAPGAFSYLNGKKVIFWSVRFQRKSGVRGKPGQVIRSLPGSLLIKTKDGLLKVLSCNGPRMKKGAVLS